MMCVWERERQIDRETKREIKNKIQYSNLDGEKVFFGAMPA